MEIYIWTSSFSFHYITAKFNFLGIKNNETVCFGVIFIANIGRIKTLEYLISQDTKDLIIYMRENLLFIKVYFPPTISNKAKTLLYIANLYSINDEQSSYTYVTSFIFLNNGII